MKRISALVILGMLLIPGLAAQEHEGNRVIRALPVEAGPQLDGLLQEEFWQLAEPVAGFRQRNPVEGADATEPTEVRVVYSQEAIYFGVTCYDSQPDRIIATQRNRDADFGRDDSFSIILDTFHSHSNSFLFEFNPLGARYDSWIFREGNEDSPEWDERWEVAVSRGESGWIAEVRIPFTALRMPSGEEQVWGIDFRRNIRRKNEEVAWSNYRRDFDFLKVSQAGHLHGLRQISSGFTYRIKPYLVLGLRRTLHDNGSASTHNESDLGLDDLKYRVTPNLTLDFTVRPDFAETEVDQQQANLTRFPLFFPEKREFFLEDAGALAFGPPPDLVLFHSRRIGLTEAREKVPILFGGRLTGKVGRYELGFLDAQTEESGQEPGRNYAVGRVVRNLFSRSRVGAAFTNVESRRGTDYSRTAATDYSFILFDHMEVEGFLVKSYSPDSEGDDLATRPIKVGWQDDFLTASAEYMIIQRNFEVEAGFAQRTDVQQTLAEFTIHPRPDSEWIRRLTLGTELWYFANQAGVLETRDQILKMGMEWESGDRTFVELARNLEQIEEPFLLRGKLFVFPGSYQNKRAVWRFRTFAGRRLSHFSSLGWEEFWGGDRWSLELSPNFILNDRATLEIDYNLDEISLPQGQLTSHVLNSVLRYNLSNAVLTTTTLQYDSTEDLLNLNFRLNYIYRPGDDVFFVFNRTRTSRQTDWSLALKVTRSFDF